LGRGRWKCAERQRSVFRRNGFAPLGPVAPELERRLGFLLCSKTAAVFALTVAPASLPACLAALEHDLLDQDFLSGLERRARGRRDGFPTVRFRLWPIRERQGHLSAETEGADDNDQNERQEKGKDRDSEHANCRSSLSGVPGPNEFHLDEQEKKEQGRHDVDAKRCGSIALRVNERSDGVADQSAQAAALRSLRASRTASTAAPASVRAKTAASAPPADHPPAYTSTPGSAASIATLRAMASITSVRGSASRSRRIHAMPGQTRRNARTPTTRTGECTPA